MCIPLWQFFVAVRDFKRSVREVRTNLVDMKSILNGTLSMSKELEAVTSEFKNVTEFYSEESKNALRDQLCAAMSTTAHEAFCHRDFLKQFKLTLDVEVSRLIEDYDRKTSQLAVLDIIQHLKRSIKEWMRKYCNDKLKTGLLVELTLYLQKSFSKHLSDGDVLLGKDVNKTNKSNIKIFCEKQYLIEMMEQLLSDHFSRDISQSDCYSDRYSKLQDLVYRKRATRIRRFRQFLTSKIQIKKIGKFYKEEISMQVSVDLKRASKEVWYHEGLFREQCSDLVQGLRALPRHRFVDVLEEENFIDLAQRLTNIKLKAFLPEAAHAHSDVLQLAHFSVKSILPKASALLGVNFSEITECLNENISKVEKPRDDDEVTSEQEFFFIPDTLKNGNIEEINTGGSCSKKNLNLPENEEGSDLQGNSSTEGVTQGVTRCHKVSQGVTQIDDSSVITSLFNFLAENGDFQLDFIMKLFDVFRNTSIGNFLSKDSIVHNIQRCQKLAESRESRENADSPEDTVTENHVTAAADQTTVTEQRLLIDPQLIYDDIENVTRKLLQLVGRKSARYTIELIDRSHMITGKAIGFLSNMHALYLYDLTEETCENIFVEKIIEIVAMDLKHEELNVLKNVIFAFSNNKKNKLSFLNKLEQTIPAAFSKHVGTAKHIEEE